MRRWITQILILVSLSGFANFQRARAENANLSAEGSYLAKIGEAPELALLDQNGRAVHLADLRGEIVLLSFVYTRCPGACPVVLHKYTELREALAKRGWLGTKVRLVLVTLDPENDTPAILREFAKQWNVAANDWLFLTGSPAAVQEALDRYHIWRVGRPDGVIDHVLRIYLIDGQGRIREIYNTSLFSLHAVLADIESLRAP